jgi:hypothetical protein
MPGFDQVEEFPEQIVNRLKPRYALVIHWENFFRRLPDDPKDLHTLPTLNAERFLERLDKVLKDNNPSSFYKLPAPGTWLRFAPS